jgi:hypothetical protein
MALKDGFDVLKLIKSDKGFIRFRETKAYHRFLETDDPRPQAGA